MSRRASLTPLQAAERYRLPLWLVWKAYVWGFGERAAALGKPDEWSVWRAPAKEVHALFGQRASDDAQATSSAAVGRAARRAARRRAILLGDHA